MYTTLGNRIRIARERAGLNQDELADKLGVHRNTVGIWERDERVPDGDSLLKLPDLLGVSADALLLGKTTGEAATLPLEALQRLRDWMDEVIPPTEETQEGGGNGDNA